MRGLTLDELFSRRRKHEGDNYDMADIQLLSRRSNTTETIETSKIPFLPLVAQWEKEA